MTPKNYLDFINTYLKLLDEKDKINLAQVKKMEDEGSALLNSLIELGFWHFFKSNLINTQMIYDQGERENSPFLCHWKMIVS